jgi:hypothetical protein
VAKLYISLLLTLCYIGLKIVVISFTREFFDNIFGKCIVLSIICILQFLMEHMIVGGDDNELQANYATKMLDSFDVSVLDLNVNGGDDDESQANYATKILDSESLRKLLDPKGFQWWLYVNEDNNVQQEYDEDDEIPDLIPAVVSQ